jgi:high affinity Mn2+ porin
VAAGGSAAAQSPPDPFAVRAGDQSIPAPFPQVAAVAADPNVRPPEAIAAPSDKPFGAASDISTENKETKEQRFNVHAQTTVVAQGDPPFAADYSGPNSLNPAGERQMTLSADLFVGLRLWQGAEIHADALMWDGHGLSDTFGVEDFPNADAYKAGTDITDFMLAHLFVRQTFGFGGEQEEVKDDELTLAGKQDVWRLTVTVGRMASTDIFDNNAYAHDGHTQFLNWAACTNVAWDNPADSVGYTTGITLDFNQPDWALRYGFFQIQGVPNGFTADDRIFKWPSEGSGGSFWEFWGMATELERRYKVNGHPGAVRGLVWLDQANYASFAVATPLLLANPPPPNTPPGALITVPAAAFAIRNHYGLGLNWEQEITKEVGVFSRVGWNDGHEVAWSYADVNWTASLGTSVKGTNWCRPDDTFGLFGVLSGASAGQIQFLKAGGTGILNGDGNLTYSTEKVVETYYDIPIGKAARFAFDYQFIADPAFNAARGPVNVFAVRLHFEQ